MKKWIGILLFSLAIMPPVEASRVEFGYGYNDVTIGTGSFDYDYTNLDSPASNFDFQDRDWDTVNFSSYINGNNQRQILIRAIGGIWFTDILLIASVDLPMYPETLSLDQFTTAGVSFGSVYDTTVQLYSLTSLGEPTVIPLPASLCLFISGLVGLASKRKSKPCRST